MKKELNDTLRRMDSTSLRKFDRMLCTDGIFRRTYYNDACGFVHDCFDWNGGAPTGYQDEMLETMSITSRYSVRGPHGLGKTAFAAWLVLWFALTRDGDEILDWKIPCTASAWRQLSKYLFPEIHKWIRLVHWSKIGRAEVRQRFELLDLSLKLRTGEAFALASDNYALIEGAHANRLLYLFDEAKTIPDTTWDAAEGALSGAGKDSTLEARAVAVSTPGEPLGRFYQIHRRDVGYRDWTVRHVKIDEVVKAGRVSQDWVDNRKEQWGETSAIYLNRVLGEFASSMADSIIPLSWIEAANERWQEWRDAGGKGNLTSVGVDVGGGLATSDASIIAPIIDVVKVLECRLVPVGDPDVATMELVGRVHGLLDSAGTGIAIVDMVGIGLGVLQRLREMGDRVGGFGSAARTDMKEKSGELGFLNWRAAMWWIVREMLEPNSGFNVCLPPDDSLTLELTSPRYKVTSSGQIQVEPKDALRKRLGRSTDHADAVLMGLTGIALLDELSRVNRAPDIIYNPVRLGNW
jgi:hypothetical protein